MRSGNPPKKLTDTKDPAPNVKAKPLLSKAHTDYLEANGVRMTNVGRAVIRAAALGATEVPEWSDEEADAQENIDPKKAWGDKKIPVGLVNPMLILEEAQQLRIGGYKYGVYNYLGKPLPAMTYVAAMFRHYLLWAGGEDNDPESGRSHLTAIRACCGILRTQQMNGDLIDDRPDWGDVRALIGELDLNWEEIKPLLDQQIEGMEK